MNAIHTILRQLDDAYAHTWESVRAVLDGVTDEAWAWQPPGYEDVEPETVWPQPGTIGWHVVHMIACKREYAVQIRDRGKAAEFEDGSYLPPATREDVLVALDEMQGRVRGEIAALEPEDLLLEANHKMALDEFLAMAIRHDTWHAGQIAVVRRLYAHRTSP